MPHAMPNAVKRASARSATVTNGEMKRGLNSLASIAVTAPFIGFLGTVIVFFGSFRGIGSEKSALLISWAKALPESLVPSALGLAVAVVPFYFYRYLSARLESFGIEIKNASLELVDALANFPTRRWL